MERHRLIEEPREGLETVRVRRLEPRDVLECPGQPVEGGLDRLAVRELECGERLQRPVLVGLERAGRRRLDGVDVRPHLREQRRDRSGAVSLGRPDRRDERLALELLRLAALLAIEPSGAERGRELVELLESQHRGERLVEGRCRLGEHGAELVVREQGTELRERGVPADRLQDARAPLTSTGSQPSRAASALHFRLSSSGSFSPSTRNRADRIVGPSPCRLRQPSRQTRVRSSQRRFVPVEQHLEPFREARLPGIGTPDDERQPRPRGEAGPPTDPPRKFSIAICSR